MTHEARQLLETESDLLGDRLEALEATLATERSRGSKEKALRQRLEDARTELVEELSNTVRVSPTHSAHPTQSFPRSLQSVPTCPHVPPRALPTCHTPNPLPTGL